MKDRNPKYKVYIRWFWGIYAFPFVLVMTLFILISREKLGPMPTFEQLENPENNLAAEVYSEDGMLLGKFFIQNRTWTEYDDISPYVVDALIATEDIRFYRHSGIDPKGLARVIIKTILMRHRQSGGGSTISQQLAKNLFPRDTVYYRFGPARMVKLGITKFKEWQTATKLERSYAKEEIITMYLNVFDFLYQAVGIKSAAYVYFNTTPDSLNLEQSAMLVGMLKNSAYYNPRRRYDETLLRRNVVLSQMVKYGYMEKEVYDSVKLLPIELDFREEGHTTGLATYFREYLRTTMIKSEPRRRDFFTKDQFDEAVYEWENNPLYGWCRKNKKPDGSNYNLYRDGIKIYTSINSVMQQYAEASVAEHLGQDLQPAFMETVSNLESPPFSNDLEKEDVEAIIQASIRRTDRYRSLTRSGMTQDSIVVAFNTPVEMTVFSWGGEIDTVMSPLDSILYYKHFARSGLMAMDPRSGYVKAYVGGPDFKYFKFDAVNSQKRQIGSTIKPFLYTLAMQDGYSPCYKVPNVPQTFKDNDSTWTPKSTGPRDFWGKDVTLKWGLAHSENYVSAWLMKRFNPQSVILVMKKMGFRSYIDPVNSIFLGTSIISLPEMVGSYATFANKGVYTEPLYVTRIEDRNGNVISRFQPRIEEAISEENAYLMINLLEGVITEGTAGRIRWKYELMNQIGGKTGTTQNHSDGWFMAVTPSLVVGVWTGWEERSIHFETLSLGGGSNMALPICGVFLKKLYEDESFGILQTEKFEPPLQFEIELNCEQYEQENRQYDFDKVDEVIY
ncbi:MAG: transglycosylase domain-containing protein [Bacteroidales bacterium]|nr:MAG: transglycosylase domain-containing protein [Bacteroidales bacterium]